MCCHNCRTESFDLIITKSTGLAQQDKLYTLIRLTLTESLGMLYSSEWAAWTLPKRSIFAGPTARAHLVFRKDKVSVVLALGIGALPVLWITSSTAFSLWFGWATQQTSLVLGKDHSFVVHTLSVGTLPITRPIETCHAIAKIEWTQIQSQLCCDVHGHVLRHLGGNGHRRDFRLSLSATSGAWGLACKDQISAVDTGDVGALPITFLWDHAGSKESCIGMANCRNGRCNSGSNGGSGRLDLSQSEIQLLWTAALGTGDLGPKDQARMIHATRIWTLPISRPLHGTWLEPNVDLHWTKLLLHARGRRFGAFWKQKPLAHGFSRQSCRVNLPFGCSRHWKGANNDEKTGMKQMEITVPTSRTRHAFFWWLPTAVFAWKL